jgi:arginyl-tRNA synthetase
VVRINYIGDWGRQFGLLGAGFERFGCQTELVTGDAIRHLFKVYVQANAACLTDAAFDKEARACSKLLEAGDEEMVALWKQFRALSAASYDKVYARLGVDFDVVTSESVYSRSAGATALALREAGALTTEPNGAKIVDLTAHKLGHAVIVKEDGGSVYLTRDIAAALHRKETIGFDQMVRCAFSGRNAHSRMPLDPTHVQANMRVTNGIPLGCPLFLPVGTVNCVQTLKVYVAGATQDLHFRQLFHLLGPAVLDNGWAADCKHVNFGNVQGMSTRRGDVVFLEDILNEARDRMYGARVSTEVCTRGCHWFIRLLG